MRNTLKQRHLNSKDGGGALFQVLTQHIRSTGIHFQGIPTLALCMEPSLQHWWKVCLGGGCLLRFFQWSVFFSHRCLQEPRGCPLHLLPLHRGSIRLCVHTHQKEEAVYQQFVMICKQFVNLTPTSISVVLGKQSVLSITLHSKMLKQQ